MHITVKDLFDFLVVTVILRGIVAKAVGAFFIKIFLRTEKDVVIWMHYFFKSMRERHSRRLDL